MSGCFINLHQLDVWNLDKVSGSEPHVSHGRATPRPHDRQEVLYHVQALARDTKTLICTSTKFTSP